MKRKNLFFTILSITVLMFFSSCSKDDDGPSMSKLSPEEHKANLNEMGVEFIDEMDDMRNEPLIEVLMHFATIMQETDKEPAVMSFAPMQYLNKFTSLKENPTNALDLKTIAVEDDNSLTATFNELKGTYTYYSLTNSWNKATNDSEIKFVFNSADGVPENDAIIRIYDFEATSASNQMVEDYTEELLESIKIELTTDGGGQLLYIGMTGNYNNDDVPTKMENEVKMVNYSWITSYEMKTPDKRMVASSTYKKGSDVMVELKLDATGDFSAETLEAMAEDNEDVGNIDDLEPLDAMDMIEKANASFRIGNLRLVGNINITKLMEDVNSMMEKYGEMENPDMEAYAKAYADVFNRNMDLYLAYVDKNQIIALLEAYAYEDDEMGWTPDFRIIFGDGTAMDDSYMSEDGFNDVLKRFEQLVGDIEDQFGIDLTEDGEM